MIDFEARTPEMLALLKKLVETESPSTDKAAVDRVGALVADECRRLGADVEVVPNVVTGNHLVARFHPHPDLLPGKEQGILLMHHMDTVFPLGTLEKMPFYSKDDKTYGPGVLDMKGGLVISLTRTHGRALLQLQAERLQACLLASGGDWFEAEACFTQTLARATNLDLPLEIARTQAAWGQAALRYAPSPHQGQRLLSEACRVLAEHQAEAELGAIKHLAVGLK